MNRIPAHITTSTSRRPFRRTGKLSALAISIAAGVGLVAAPIVSTLTASPAGATGAITAVGILDSASGIGLGTLNDNPVTVGDVLVVSAEPGAATPTSIRA